MTKKVVLLGKGELAVSIGEWFRQSDDYALQCVVPVVPEPAWADSLITWCDANKIPFVQTGRYEDIPGVQDGD